MEKQDDISSILGMNPSVMAFIDMMLDRKLKERNKQLDDASSDDMQLLIKLLLKEHDHPNAVPRVLPIGGI